MPAVTNETAQSGRVAVLGDNYGMGVSAGTYLCEQFGDNPDAVIAEIAGIDSLPLASSRWEGWINLKPVKGAPADIDDDEKF